VWTLECEHVYSWNMYGDELCDYQMQMCWFVTINVLGGATRIWHLNGQGHPMRGTCRWASTCFLYNVNVQKWFIYGWYIIVLSWMLNRLWNDVELLMKVKPTMKCWLASPNDILKGWSSCVWWLASANGIQDGWQSYVWWLASATGIRDWWSSYVWWLATTNGIQDKWRG
jgi:hypothetical protein